MEGVKEGLGNVEKEMGKVGYLGERVVVGLKGFGRDREEEVEGMGGDWEEDLKVGLGIKNGFGEGGEGGVDLGKVVVERMEKKGWGGLEYS